MAATVSAPTPVVASLPTPGRLGAILAVLAWPLWIGCFVLLYGSQGARPDTVPTLTEQHAAAMAAPAASWGFGVLATIAVVVLAAAPAVIGVALGRRTGRWAIPGVLMGAAVITGALELWNTVSFQVLLASGPENLPGWAQVVDQGAPLNTVVNAVSWSVCALAVPLLGFALWRARVLPRAGLIVAIIGAVFLAAMLALQFGQPMSSAILLFVLGVALLRRRKPSDPGSGAWHQTE